MPRVNLRLNSDYRGDRLVLRYH